MTHNRAHIKFDRIEQATKFVETLNSDGSADKWVIESFNGEHTADARSVLGVIYMMTTHNDDCYLYNVSHPEMQFPSWVDAYRAIDLNK